MIKKILIFAALFFLCAVPALANDGGGLLYDNTNKVTFSVKTISENVQIGEYYMFTLVATNNTGYSARVFKFEGIFEDENNLFLEDDDIYFPESDIVPPHSTVEMDFAYKVPENIHWYLKDNKYYVNLDPEIIYFATDLPEDIEFNEEIAEDWPTNGYDVINNCVNTIPLEITNMFDASEIAEIESSFGEKAYYAYYESSDIVINYGYLLKTSNESSTTILNISNEPFEYICSNGYAKYNNQWQIETIAIEPNEKFDTQESSYIPRYAIGELPQEVVVSNAILLRQNGKYYGLYTSSKVPAIPYSQDSIKISWKTEELENDIKVTFTVSNKSGNDLNNFVFAKDLGYQFEITENLDDIVIIPLFEKNQIFTYEVYIPKYYSEKEYFKKSRIYGWQIENTMFLYESLVEYLYEDNEFKTIVQEKEYYDDKTGETTYINDTYYYNEYSITEFFSSLEAEPSESESANINEAEVTPSGTAAPISSANDAAEKLQQLESRLQPVIPEWVWVLLGVSAVAAASLIFIHMRRTNKNNKDIK